MGLKEKLMDRFDRCLFIFMFTMLPINIIGLIADGEQSWMNLIGLVINMMVISWTILKFHDEKIIALQEQRMIIE